MGCPYACWGLPRQSVVWVAGEAGEGKSTLAEAAADELTAGGWRAAWGRCPEVEGAPPGWAWQEIGEGLGFTARTGTASPFLLARAIGAELAALAVSSPVLVVIDDVHRADSLTLQLLRQVVDSLDGAPVLLLVTYRPSEAAAALTGTRAAVAARSDHLSLHGLDYASVAELARSAGLVAGDDTIDVLTERTGGNPLFVRELARAAGGSRLARGPGGGAGGGCRRPAGPGSPAAVVVADRVAAGRPSSAGTLTSRFWPTSPGATRTISSTTWRRRSWQGSWTNRPRAGCASPTPWCGTPSSPTRPWCAAPGCTRGPSRCWLVGRRARSRRWPTMRWRA